MRILTALLTLIPLTSYAQAPAWTANPGRQIVGGDIVQTSVGQGPTVEYAQFIARQSAIKALIEECGGVANKDIVPWSSYTTELPNGFEAWAQVSLVFVSCDYAKHNLSEIDRKRLENSKIAEEQKLYDNLMSAQLNAPKSMDDALIKAAQDKVEQYLKQQATTQHDDINDLKQQMAIMQGQLSLMQRPIEAVKIPATNSDKKLCEVNLRHKMTRLQELAGPKNGNMADPSMREHFNEAMFNMDICARMQ